MVVMGEAVIFAQTVLKRQIEERRRKKTDYKNQISMLGKLMKFQLEKRPLFPSQASE